VQQKIILAGLQILIPVEREKILEQFKEEFLCLVDSLEGARLACCLLDYYTAKDRKIILKLFKGKALEYLKNESSYCYLVIIKIFYCIDDTVLIHKNILNDLDKNLDQLVDKPHFGELFLSIFDAKSNYLEKNGIGLTDFTSSKKDEATRRNELIEYCVSPLLNCLSFDIRKHLTDANRCKLMGCMVSEIMNRATGEDDPNLALVASVVNTIITDYREHANAANTNNTLLICHQFTHRMIKSFVIECASYTGPAKEFYLNRINEIYELVLEELGVLVNTRAIFIIIAFIEFTDCKEQLINELNGMKHLLKKGASENSAGLKILLKHLEE